MTSALYIVSIEPAGKTALAAVIGRKLINQGKKAGYFIPLALSESGRNYQDASFIKEVLNLAEDVNRIDPIHKSPMSLWKTLTENPEDLLEEIKASYREISEDKDFVLIEGLGGLIRDGDSTLACYRISEAVNVPVLVVLRYAENMDPSIFSKIIQQLGSRMAGVIINFIPEKRMDFVRKETVGKFEKAGIKVFGLIKEDRALAGISVGDLVQRLGGELITAKDNTEGIIENIMLAGLPLDTPAGYFGRKSNKAVVIRSERYDNQLAALETSTTCLILTGNAEPQSMVTNFAEEKKIPIMLVKKETEEVLAELEKASGMSFFNNRNKLERLEKLLLNWDIKPLFSATGLAL